MDAGWSSSSVFSGGMVIGIMLVAFDKWLISKICRPVGYWLCGVAYSDRTTDVEDKQYIVQNKVPVWLESGVLHSIEVLFCLVYAYQWTWWRDIANWPNHVLLVQDGISVPFNAQERDHIAPFYTFYFGYVCFTFVRDVFLKQERTGGNKMFTVHHVLTVGLVASSFHYGNWRAGFLTRLLLGLGEVTLYFGKVYGAREQVGKGSRPLLGCLFMLNAVVWGCMRCAGYAYLCYSLSIMYAREYTNWGTDTFAACTAMLLGSWAMLVLQLIWTPFIAIAGLKFLRTGKMDDPVHRDSKRTEEQGDETMPGCSTCLGGGSLESAARKRELNAGLSEER